jgi:hypothetical protein
MLSDGEKARDGKYEPSRDGKKRINIKAFSNKGKIEVILPSGDVLTVEEKKKK